MKTGFLKLNKFFIFVRLLSFPDYLTWLKFRGFGESRKFKSTRNPKYWLHEKKIHSEIKKICHKTHLYHEIKSTRNAKFWLTARLNLFCYANIYMFSQDMWIRKNECEWLSIIFCETHCNTSMKIFWFVDFQRPVGWHN